MEYSTQLESVTVAEAATDVDTSAVTWGSRPHLSNVTGRRMSSSCFQTRRGCQINYNPDPDEPACSTAPPLLCTPARAHLHHSISLSLAGSAAPRARSLPTAT
ncbi:hypothetical protein P171DRAFT_37394 [Karstenula rhodostoma CBS 690.94]|uniref:Uncharacterized protein n=1 Tax=Karstenula rhodostoma CBS 690.94 TaxID=1392251 RepID=A0A9P4PIC2_9PLEO|nr:hypothetical protein P171DRAFT_37394 [Karstenula rhodostoma CBS 690.94]